MPVYRSEDPYWKYRQLDRMGSAMGMIAGAVNKRRDRKLATDQKEMDRFLRMAEQNAEFGYAAAQKFKDRFGEQYPMFGEMADFYRTRGEPIAKGREAFEKTYMPKIMETKERVGAFREAAKDTIPLSPLRPDLQEDYHQLSQYEDPSLIKQYAFESMAPEQQQNMYVFGQQYGMQLPEPRVMDPSKRTAQAETAKALHGPLGEYGEPGSPTFEAVEGKLQSSGQRVEEYAEKQGINLNQKIDYATEKHRLTAIGEAQRQANRLDLEDRRDRRAAANRAAGGKSTSGDPLIDYATTFQKLQLNDYDTKRDAIYTSLSDISAATDGPVPPSKATYENDNPIPMARDIPQAFKVKWAAAAREIWDDPIARQKFMNAGYDLSTIMEQYMLRYSENARSMAPNQAFTRSLKPEG